MPGLIFGHNPNKIKHDKLDSCKKVKCTVCCAKVDQPCRGKTGAIISGVHETRQLAYERSKVK